MSAAPTVPTAMTRARSAWGEALPDWVEALAQAADTSSQARAAKAIGYSAATVSCVIARRYSGDLARVEESVRAALMHGAIVCPELGDLALAQCLEWRGKAKDFQPTSTQRRIMYRACRGCPHNEGGSDA